MRAGALVSAALAVVGGCGHLGINFDGGCSTAAGAVDAAEGDVIAAAARSLYGEGDLRLARETALEDIWPHRLRAMHLEETPLRVPLTVSRPGFDGAGNTALLVYRLERDGTHIPIEARSLVLRKVPKRGWSVVNSVRTEP